ncbi:MAG: HAMP domain-containing sensor histidine kinase [Planctomycetota bacterium]
MWRGLQTLRCKLAAVFLAVFGLIQIGLYAAVLVSRERDLREQFDARLLDRAWIVADEIASRMEQSQTAATDGERRRRMNPFRFPGFYCQLRQGDIVLERSRSLGDWELPLTEEGRAAKRRRQPVFETIGGPLAAGLAGQDGALRLTTIYRQAASSGGFFLQIAAGTEHLERSVQRLRRLLLIVVPSGLLFAGLASWLLAGRALAPLSRVAETADRLEAANLSLRFEQRQRADEVTSVVDSLNRMLERLSEGFASQERFISGVAHELKTPLTVLLSKAQVLLQKERPVEEHTRFVSDVQDEVRAMSQTVESLLALARAEAGLPLGAVTKVSVNDVVMDAVSRCGPLAAQRAVRLAPHIAVPNGDRGQPLVVGDAPMLTLMFANLLRNALRYSAPGQPVDVMVSLEERTILVSIRDRGPGVPSEYVDRIFDRFFSVPDAAATFQGVGLGLTIARGVARLHGGDVRVSNHPEGGCQFVVDLPAADGEPRHAD